MHVYVPANARIIWTDSGKVCSKVWEFTSSIVSRIAFGFPGRFMMSALPRSPAVCRDSTAVGTYLHWKGKGDLWGFPKMWEWKRIRLCDDKSMACSAQHAICFAFPKNLTLRGLESLTMSLCCGWKIKNGSYEWGSVIAAWLTWVKWLASAHHSLASSYHIPEHMHSLNSAPAFKVPRKSTTLQAKIKWIV